METTLGGERLGSGPKQKIHLRDYERSTHDLSYIWRSTMSSGTLVPFMGELALPGDTHEIKLDCDIMTHPTIGPLFGSYKVQLDVFTIPIRLYNAALHMNMLNIGLNMKEIYLPQVQLNGRTLVPTDDLDNAQVHSSCIFSYLDVRGIGQNLDPDVTYVEKQVCALKYLAYWDIYKNYYANKQEGIGYVIHNDLLDIDWTVTTNSWNGGAVINPINDEDPRYTYGGPDTTWVIFTTDPLTEVSPDRIKLWYGGADGRYYEVTINEVFNSVIFDLINNEIICSEQILINGYTLIGGYEILNDVQYEGRPELTQFPLTNIDEMRLQILQADITTPFLIDRTSIEPYNLPLNSRLEVDSLNYSLASNQEGLGIKTYQSDIFNNWLDTDWIDGPNGINDITSIDTAGGSITVNEIMLAKKIYDMLNRIAVSGGSYDDWLDATYTHERMRTTENPIYMGGLSKELVFQEVISTTATIDEPLGTLAGRGRLSSKNKGGYVKIKTDEPSYIMGIISLTPRIDYSQGNKWDTDLKTMDDFHKPALDGIGFQDLLTSNMAYWDTVIENGVNEFTPSAGKQPAWINYMTNTNKVRGNFATATQQMYMTLNRKYEPEWDVDNQLSIKDLTTYIDPSKFNHIFADTRLDAQNFWAQIKVDITARRKMSAKIMPNL